MNNKHILQVVAKTPLWGFDLAWEIAITLNHNGYEVMTFFLNGKLSSDTPKLDMPNGDFLAILSKNAKFRLSANQVIKLDLIEVGRFDNNHDSMILIYRKK